LKKCNRCGTELTHGQQICHHCGKPQERLRRVRCRNCGAVGERSLAVCPACGEALRQDWLRPLSLVLALIAIVALGLLVGPWLLRQVDRWQPGQAISTVQAMVSDVPVLVDVPTLTPSLTPSPTPTPTNTPTNTPVPTATPRPTLTATPTNTPSPTSTYTPSPTPTRTRRPPTPTRPTNTPTPAPTVAPPLPSEPEDGAPFGSGSIFRLAWSSSHLLRTDQCYLVKVRYVHQGVEVTLPVCVQETFWWVDKALYLQADQETDRVYHWTVQVVQITTDAEGQDVYTPLGPPSEEWSFYWR
jgi:RNA polymerase subunit RPABC4/transcription elongation factor Spt4